MKQICDILDELNILYDWYVLGTSFKKEEFTQITSWFKYNPNVHFMGYKDNVYPYVKQMDYLALLTDREACCLVISEALILGIPCIVTNFKGVEKQIVDGYNGIVVEMEDIDNYKRKLSNVIEVNKKLKENIQKCDYSKESIINKWIDIL